MRVFSLLKLFFWLLVSRLFQINAKIDALTNQDVETKGNSKRMWMGSGRRGNCLISWWLQGVVLQLLFLFVDSQNLHRRTLMKDNIQANLPSPGVQLLQNKEHVVLCNGIVSITLTVPGGAITSISYNGSENLLETQDRKERDRGHWDVVWNTPGGEDITDNLEGTSYKVTMQDENQTEISFTRTWRFGSRNVPLNIDKRFVMLRDSPGFYSYAVLERLKGWPAYDIPEGRIVFKLQGNIFHYMAIDDERQRFMPTPEDRATGQVLDYREAVLLTNPTNPDFKGEVDDKYFYSCDDEDNKVHGWVGSHPPVGFWMITPSNEFRTGGPMKQDLTSHVGPIVLSMFISRHYAGEDLALKFEAQEYWKKVFGPVYIYLNSDASAQTNPSVLWEDAKQRMEKEVASWPYNFPRSEDFLKSKQRGTVSGQLLIRDWFISEQAVPRASAYVGLASPGEAGSWQFENKGYEFWTQTDSDGKFLIRNVIPGTYSLFAWVPGILGDYKHAHDITITPTSKTFVARNLVFEAQRKGATLWEIGIPDRSAAEFFIPDPSPTFKIHQYGDNPVQKFRQYGLWTRYKDLYPDNVLVFTVGTSNYSRDWFFAHVTRWEITITLRQHGKFCSTLKLSIKEQITLSNWRLHQQIMLNYRIDRKGQCLSKTWHTWVVPFLQYWHSRKPASCWK